MDRVDLKILNRIMIEMDRYDIEIGSTGNVVSGMGDFKYAETFLTLRFGYWKELDGLELITVNNILEECNAKIVLDFEDYDSDCGRKVDYKIVRK